ncbi:MAG: GNAT family N-acetyltransferase [Acidimicrobiia bacterium]
MIRIGPVSPPATYELRREVLRPHQPVEEMDWPRDSATDALHVAAEVEGRPVAVASIVPEGPRGETEGWWRVRGMATRAEYRNRGLGGRLLSELLAHTTARGGGTVWCNARIGAVSLYERHGFRLVSDVFELADIGPHVRMELEAASR